MTRDTTGLSHAAVDEMLPWYVNGTLEASEHARVDAHLVECAECRDGVVELRRLARAVTGAGPTPLVREPDTVKLNALIDDVERRERGQRIGLALVASLIAVVAAGLFAIGLDVNHRSGPARFEAATGTVEPQLTDYVVLVETAPDIPAARQRTALVEMGLRDISETQDPHIYRGVVSLPAKSIADLDAESSRHAERVEIRSVRFIAVQLPVESTR